MSTSILHIYAKVTTHSYAYKALHVHNISHHRKNRRDWYPPCIDRSRRQK